MRSCLASHGRKGCSRSGLQGLDITHALRNLLGTAGVEETTTFSPALMLYT